MGLRHSVGVFASMLNDVPGHLGSRQTPNTKNRKKEEETEAERKFEVFRQKQLEKQVCFI